MLPAKGESITGRDSERCPRLPRICSCDTATKCPNNCTCTSLGERDQRRYQSLLRASTKDQRRHDEDERGEERKDVHVTSSRRNMSLACWHDVAALKCTESRTLSGHSRFRARNIVVGAWCFSLRRHFR